MTEPKRRGRPPKAIQQDAPSKRTETFKRESFGGRTHRLGVPEEYKDPGYWYYWFRDEGDNLYRARRAGYSDVSYEEAGRHPDRDANLKDPCVAHGGVGEAGRPYKMCLMKLPRNLREEDEAKAAELADAIDDSVYRQEFEGGKYGHHSVQIKDEE